MKRLGEAERPRTRRHPNRRASLGTRRTSDRGYAGVIRERAAKIARVCLDNGELAPEQQITMTAAAMRRYAILSAAAFDEHQMTAPWTTSTARRT